MMKVTTVNEGIVVRGQAEPAIRFADDKAVVATGKLSESSDNRNSICSNC